jgi:hypothetical protein
MIRLRTASALAAGALAAVTIAGTAPAAGLDDGPPRRVASSAASTGPDHSVVADSPRPDDSPGADDGFGSVDGSATASPAPTVGTETARLIALRSVGGGRVTKLERETEHGIPVYDVRVVRDGVRHDLHVDAFTGTLLRHRVDGDDHRGRGRDNGGRDGDDRGRRHGGHGSDD